MQRLITAYAKKKNAPATLKPISSGFSKWQELLLSLNTTSILPVLLLRLMQSFL